MKHITRSFLFFGYGKNIFRPSFPFFSSLQEQCSILFFLIFIFQIQAQGALDPFKNFKKFIVPYLMARTIIIYDFISTGFSKPEARS